MPSTDAMLEMPHANPAVALSVLLIAGILSGLINTMAGGGAFFTLPILVAMGIPPVTANGTIRVGVLLQNISGTLTFWRQGKVEWGLWARLVVPVCAGAMFGAQIAIRLDNAIFRPLFGGALLVWAIILLIRPGRFVRASSEPRAVDGLALVLAVAVGFYGGFLQAGVGFPLIALIVMFLGREVVGGNGVKMALVLAYTLLTLPAFALADQVAWEEGATLGIGMMLGAWLGARWQIRSGANIVRWFVLVMIVVSGILMLRSP